MEAESAYHVRLDHEPPLDVAFAVLQVSSSVAVYNMLTTSLGTPGRVLKPGMLCEA